MNKIIVIGNLGRDPELRYTPNGQTVANFSVASNRRYTANGEQKEETQWFNCAVWGRLAEVANQYLTRGQQVYVEGRLRVRTYTAQSGEERLSLDINVTEFQMLGGGRNGQDPNGHRSTPAGAHSRSGNLPSNVPPPDEQYMEADDLSF